MIYDHSILEVPVPKKRIARNETKKNYSEQHDEDMEDPFSFNSDDDPEFVVEKEEPQPKNIPGEKKKLAKLLLKPQLKEELELLKQKKIVTSINLYKLVKKLQKIKKKLKSPNQI